MATKKKVVKAAPKKAASKASKSAPVKSAKKAVPKKAASKPVAKKTVPAKKAAKPAAKPAAKKVAASKAVKTTSKKVASKPVAKPTAKKVVVPAKKAVTTKPPVKTAPVAVKTAPKKVEKVIKPTAKKEVAVKVPARPKHVAPKANAVNIKDIKVIPAKTVHVPKITTKTARPYKPEFGKSILDNPDKSNPGAPLVRYSDSELAEFKELIERKLENARKELSFFQELMTRKGEMGGDESENRYMTMEDGSESAERERQAQMISRAITFIDHLEKALIRIENKTYGVCRMTGKLIEKARLRAVPHATLSYEAKMMSSNK